MEQLKTRARRLRRALGLMAVFSFAGVASGATRAIEPSPAADITDSTITRPDETALALASFAGRSGKLRARFVSQASSLEIPALSRLFGDSAARKVGVYTIHGSPVGRQFALIVMRPFSDKRAGRIGSYRVGYWPFERSAPRSGAYANPMGFIEVTPESQNTYVSRHFGLRALRTPDE